MIFICAFSWQNLHILAENLKNMNFLAFLDANPHIFVIESLWKYVGRVLREPWGEKQWFIAILTHQRLWNCTRSFNWNRLTVNKPLRRCPTLPLERMNNIFFCQVNLSPAQNHQERWSNELWHFLKHFSYPVVTWRS